jgi:hypothetical protein
VQDLIFSSDDESMGSDHSSSYDGGGDSESLSADSSEDVEVCATCFDGTKDALDCSGCGVLNCHTFPCSRECVACKEPMCKACFFGKNTHKLCKTCHELLEFREVTYYDSKPFRPACTKSPLAFQKMLDRISVAMGLDPEYELRGEDGLEVWPPLRSLPKQAGRGQRTIDDFVRPALMLVPPGAVLLSDKPHTSY